MTELKCPNFIHFNSKCLFFFKMQNIPPWRLTRPGAMVAWPRGRDGRVPLWGDHNLSRFVSITSVKLWWIDVKINTHRPHKPWREGNWKRMHSYDTEELLLPLCVTMSMTTHSLKVSRCNNYRVSLVDTRIQQLSEPPPTELIPSAIIRMQIISPGIQSKCKLSLTCPALSPGRSLTSAGSWLGWPRGKLHTHSISAVFNVFI